MGEERVGEDVTFPPFFCRLLSRISVNATLSQGMISFYVVPRSMFRVRCVRRTSHHRIWNGLLAANAGLLRMSIELGSVRRRGHCTLLPIANKIRRRNSAESSKLAGLNRNPGSPTCSPHIVSILIHLTRFHGYDSFTSSAGTADYHVSVPMLGPLARRITCTRSSKICSAETGSASTCQNTITASYGPN